MKMRTTTVAVSMLILASMAIADDRNTRRDNRDVSGRIAWSTRDRSGNRLGISFDFSGRNTRFNVNYRQDRSGSYSYGRNDRYDRRDHHYTPPNYDYRRYKHGEYDHHHFSSYQEWNDWRNWQSQWNHHRGWAHSDHERQRAWQAFRYERERAHRAYDNRRYRSSRDHRGRDGRDDRRRSRRDG